MLELYIASNQTNQQKIEESLVSNTNGRCLTPSLTKQRLRRSGPMQPGPQAVEDGPWCTYVQSFGGTFSFFCKHKIVDTEKKHQNSFCTVPLLLMMLRISPRKCFPGQGTTWMHVVLVQIKNIACQKLAKSCQSQNPSPFSSSKTLHMWDSYTCDFSYTKMNFPDSSLWKNSLGILSKKTFASLITTVQKSCKTNHSRSCGVNNDHFKSFLTLMRMCKFMLQEL